jgi:uncharacterized protein (TIGR03663 family)
VTAISIFLRFYWLGVKPLHHDEGVNGWFLTNLFRDGMYKYDPANYHGPTLYYISLAFARVFGLETVSVRASVAVFGVLSVILVFFLRRYIGKIGALFAGLFIALSPGLVFISRYFIHETFFVFLSLGVVVSIVLYIERRSAGPFAIASAALLLLVCFYPLSLNIANVVAGENVTLLWALRLGLLAVEAVLIVFVIRMLRAWDDGRPVYVLLAAACTSLMFATKETTFITLGTMVIACACIPLWKRLYKRGIAGNGSEISDDHLTWANFRSALTGGSGTAITLIAAAVVFIYIGVLFFSSFFTYPEGVGKALEAYSIWTKTGTKDHTQNGLWAYFEWLWELEAPILIMSVAGAAIAFFKVRHRFAMFIALWGFGLLAAYTIIPYKTPWLAISFLLPMAIAAGYAVNELVTSGNPTIKIAGAAAAVAASSVLAYQTYDLNFVRYDDEDTAYVYAHTNREFLGLISEIERYAAKSGKGNDTAVQVVSPDYWPMVWYMKDYPKAVFHGKLVNPDGAEMIVAKRVDQDAEMMRRYAASYQYAGSYRLRPGVELVLLVRKDLADADTMPVYRIREGQ